MWPKSNESDANTENVDVDQVDVTPAAPVVPKSPFAVDEFSGRGGSYVIDPDTQTRKPSGN